MFFHILNDIPILTILFIIFIRFTYVLSLGKIVSCIFQRSEQEIPHSSFLTSLHAWWKGT